MTTPGPGAPGDGATEGLQIRVGTRGSTLALTQTGLVRDEVARLLGRAADTVELVRIRTEGDHLTGSLAALGGAGVFVAALREALLDGRCELAVHSLKDLPTVPSPGLVVAAVPAREDPRDALCARDGLTLQTLPPGSLIGTGSPRRAAQLLAARPDCTVVDIRGNVDTRLRRVRATGDPGTGIDPAEAGLHGGDLDAVVLAAAGLTRLGRLDAVTELLDPVLVAPAAGQGALAVECRADVLAAGGPLAAALAALDHLPSRLAVTAEREVLLRLEAGCAAPIGAYARMSHGQLVGDHLALDHLTLDVVVCAPDGSTQLRTSASVRLPDDREGQIASALDLGRQVAAHLLAAGAADVAPVGPAARAEVAPGAEPADPTDPAAETSRGAGAPGGALVGWRVLVPRGGEWGARVAGLLEAHGGEAVVVPLIDFAPPVELTRLDSALTGLALGLYDWVTITSGTTVPYLAARAAMHVGTASGIAPSPAVALAALLGNAQVAAVGPGTAAALERIGVAPDLVPVGERSAGGLLAEFPPPPPPLGEGLVARVLVPHSDLAEPTLADGLRAAGWQVDDVVAYRTVSGDVAAEGLREGVRSGAFDAVLLSSASAVTHLVELGGTPPASTVVCCIGPRTRAAALDLGLPVHVVPDLASAESLVEALVRHAQEVPRP